MATKTGAFNKKAVDLVLTLFPFEEAFYRQHGVSAQFIGHPLADLIEINPSCSTLRKNITTILMTPFWQYYRVVG